MMRLILRAITSLGRMMAATIWLTTMALWLSLSVARAETAWVGDLPVPDDALIETTSAVNFDSPSGRIISFTFYSDKSEDAITQFYQGRLAELGWQSHGTAFHRGSETLQILPSGAGDGSRNAYLVTVGPKQSE
ncbi:MAG: hypothetical protein ACON49_04925 [Candidatus Puniceispirillaceae bacterium]